jgi:hypothetical protein
MDAYQVMDYKEEKEEEEDTYKSYDYSIII